MPSFNCHTARHTGLHGRRASGLAGLLSTPEPLGHLARSPRLQRRPCTPQAGSAKRARADFALSTSRRAFLKQHCPNLISFVARFRAAYWPDWEAKCEKQPKRPAMPAAKAAIVAIKAARKQEKALAEGGGSALLRRSSAAVGIVLLAAIAAWLH